ncbi:MAG: hypothetical protein U0798_18475 [Gemmataceae bacterium]
MPTIVESAPVARIDQQLHQAAGRIRMTDLMSGLLAIIAMTLGYAVLMIILDRSFELPGWVRQVSFVGWLGLMAVAAYRMLIVPMSRSVNPLFVAKQVESAIPDAKNVVVNYVDLKGANLPVSVQSAVAKQASAEVTESDVHKAGESQRLVALGISSVALAVLLAILFLVFSPAQFNSLVSRTFRPFASTQIVSKTRISITFPEDPNVSVTSGLPVVLQVMVDGRLPHPDAPDRVRLMLRHNPEDPSYETVPFEPGSTSREFQLKVPEYLVQNGFWYKVAGGDGETQEYRVTVRPRPLATGFAVTYEYPAYLRMPKETTDRPQIEAYRGTKVTLAVKTNRPLRDGRMSLEGIPDLLPGAVTAEDPETIRYSWTVSESGSYRLFFTATDGETNADSPVYPIKVIPDNPPTITIAKPEQDDLPLPANGRVEIDATAQDDLGVAKLVIKSRLLGTVPTPIQDKSYAVPLKRATDGSYPTRVEMKDSLLLNELKSELGTPLRIKEGDTIEFWIEVTDNCEVPAPHVVKSAIKRVTIQPAVVEPEKKQELDKKNEQRKNEEKKQEEQQKQQFDKEQRPPPAGQKDKQPNPEQNPEQQPQQNQDPNQSQEKGTESNPMKGSTNDPNKGTKSGSGDPQQQPETEKPNTKGNPEKGNPEKGNPNETANPMNPMNPMNPREGGNANSSATPMPMTNANPNENKEPNPSPNSTASPTPERGSPETSPDRQQKNQDLIKQAEQVKNELDKQNPKSNGSNDPNQQQPTKDDLKKLENAARDLNSPDPDKRKAAEETIDKAIGKENREKAQKQTEQLKKDLQSDDKQTRENAEKKVKDMADQMAKAGGNQSQQGNQNPPTPEQQKEIAKAAQDLTSNDPNKQKAAEKKLDEMIGKENRENAQKQAEQLKKDLQSDDKQTRENAEKKVKEMADQLAKAGEQKGGQQNQPNNQGTPPTPEQQKDIAKAAKDLASNDPDKRKAAETKLDEMIGKENRENAQKQAEQLKKDLQSDDKQTRENAEKKMQEMADQMAKAGGNQNQSGKPNEKQPTKDQIEEFKKAAEQAASKDPATRKAGEEKLDQMIGKDARQQAQKEADQLKKDLQSNDKQTRENAEKKLDKMAQDMKDQMAKAGGNQNPQEQPGKQGTPTPEQQKELAKAAKDLASNDPEKQKAAEKKLDEMIGKENREKAQKDAEQLKKDLQSNDKQTRENAEKKLDKMAQDMKDQMAKAGGNSQSGQPKPDQQQKPMTPEQMKELANAAKDLNSSDPAKKKAAEEKVDSMVGKENREKAQQMAKDLQSNDPQTRKAAEDKMKEMANQMAKQNADQKNQKNGAGSPQSEKDKQDIANAMKDLNSPDADKREAAKKTLDEKIGENNRKQAEGLQKDLASNNPAVRQDAEKKAEELTNQSGQKPGDQNGDKGLSPEEAKKLAEKAKDLTSKDENKRKQAEKELDDKVGKDNREKLQNMMNDLQSGDPKKAEEAQKQLDEWQKQAQQNNPGAGPLSKNWNEGGFGGGKKGGDPLKDNPADRLKSYELQLETFKQNRNNKDLKQKLGYTDEEYDRMIAGMEAMIKDQQKWIDVQAKSKPTAPPKSINVNQGSEKIQHRGADGAGPIGATSGAAPAGYSDASKKFAEEAAKKKGN